MARNFMTAGVALLLACVVGGCRGIEPGTPLSVYHRDSSEMPKLQTVEKEGNYGLYPGSGVDPLDSFYFHRGDQFGFESREGQVVGVANVGGEAKTIRLSGVLTSEYIWKFQGEKK
ncbi:MAG TPA: hypothetical protein VG269_26170 [Tepidisphaeraceae bacterium]|nr:hypothetical protein [Tepidisphaeraceae bacterium]